jgi:hypothetical protein
VTAQFSQRAGGQSFRNNSNQNANILNTFQVQQEGTEIRVVDSDGSTYTGKIEPVTEMADRAMAKRKQGYESRLEKDNKTETAQSRFRASGYNVSMKKQLIFEGDYVAPLQAPVAQQLDIGKKADTAAPQQQQQAARITGTARVNGEAPVQVDATEVPASPMRNERRTKGHLNGQRPTSNRRKCSKPAAPPAREDFRSSSAAEG